MEIGLMIFSALKDMASVQSKWNELVAGVEVPNFAFRAEGKGHKIHWQLVPVAH
jgi:hypothetical protein